MEMGLGGLKVLVTAGAGGIGSWWRRPSGRRARRSMSATSTATPWRPCRRGSPAPMPTSPRARTSPVCSRKPTRRSAASIASSTMPASPGRRAVSRRSTRRTGTAPSTSASRAVQLRASGGAAAAPERQPSIVNLSSAAGRFGFPLRTPYAAAKWAVIGFTKSLSRELGPDGIRVNAVLPASSPATAKPGAGGQGAATRDQLLRDGERGLCGGLDQGLRSRPASSPTRSCSSPRRAARPSRARRWRWMAFLQIAHVERSPRALKSEISGAAPGCTAIGRAPCAGLSGLRPCIGSRRGGCGHGHQRARKRPPPRRTSPRARPPARPDGAPVPSLVFAWSRFTSPRCTSPTFTSPRIIAAPADSSREATKPGDYGWTGEA